MRLCLPSVACPLLSVRASANASAARAAAAPRSAFQCRAGHAGADGAATGVAARPQSPRAVAHANAAAAIKSLRLLDDWGLLSAQRCMVHPLVVEARVVRRQVAVLQLHAAQ